jgi:hypothetical protein
LAIVLIIGISIIRKPIIIRYIACHTVTNWWTKSNCDLPRNPIIIVYIHNARKSEFHCRRNNTAKWIISNIPVGFAIAAAAKNNHARIAYCIVIL